MIIRMQVVFPDPFGPMSPHMAPRGTSKFSSETAAWSPKHFVTPSSRIAYLVSITNSRHQGMT